MKILVYNENEKSRLVVGQLLKELSFSVILADSEEKLFEELKTESTDLVILDVNSFDNFTDVISDVLKHKIAMCYCLFRMMTDILRQKHC